MPVDRVAPLLPSACPWTRAALASAAVALTLAPTSAADACSCLAPPPPREALEASRDVFEGQVLAIERGGAPDAPAPGEDGAPPPAPGVDAVRVTFAVVRAWKGAENERLTVVTGPNSAACGYGFEESETYLVYTTAGDDGGPPRTGLCSRTRPIAAAGDDLRALGAGVVPVDVDPDAPAPEPTAAPPARGGCASCATAGDPGAGLAAGLLGVTWAAVRTRRRR